MKKLTLSAEEEIIEQAKKIAKKHHTSVSALFGRLIRFLSEYEKRTSKISPIAQNATGIITLPKNKTEKEVLEKALMEKEGF